MDLTGLGVGRGRGTWAWDGITGSVPASWIVDFIDLFLTRKVPVVHERRGKSVTHHSPASAVTSSHPGLRPSPPHPSRVPHPWILLKEMPGSLTISVSVHKGFECLKNHSGRTIITPEK